MRYRQVVVKLDSFFEVAAHLRPRINFDGLNNGTNVTKIDASTNISNPSYNMDQDYSNMTNVLRLRPFIFKRSVKEFLDSDVIKKHIENVTTAAYISTDEKMTDVIKKNADDVSKNISNVSMNKKHVTNNDIIDHSNTDLENVTTAAHASTDQKMADMTKKNPDDISKNIWLNITTVPKNRKRVMNIDIIDHNTTDIPNVATTAHASSDQKSTDMTKKNADDVSKNISLNITTVPKKKKRMTNNDNTDHSNTEQNRRTKEQKANNKRTKMPNKKLVKNNDIIDHRNTNVQNVTTTAHASTDQKMTDMTKKNADDVSKNMYLNIITVPKNKKLVTNNDINDHSNTDVQNLTTTAHASTDQKMRDMNKKNVDDVSKNISLNIITVPKNEKRVPNNDIRDHNNTDIQNVTTTSHASTDWKMTDMTKKNADDVSKNISLNIIAVPKNEKRVTNNDIKDHNYTDVQNVTTTAHASTGRKMTDMTKKNADDVSKNISLNITTALKNKKRVKNNDINDHSNTDVQNLTTTAHASTDQNMRDMTKKNVDDVSKNISINITTVPKNKRRMMNNDMIDQSNTDFENVTTTAHASTDRKMTDMTKKNANDVSKKITAPKKKKRVMNNDTIDHSNTDVQNLTTTAQDSTRQPMTNMAKKNADDVSKNISLNVTTVPKNKKRVTNNDIIDHSNTYVENVTTTAHASTDQKMTDVTKKITDAVSKNISLNITTVRKNKKRVTNNDTTDQSISTY